MRSIAALVVLTCSAAVDAGVALDMITRDMAGEETERSQVFAQDGFLRLDSDGGPFASDVSLIFDGTRFLVLDHAEKTYIIMDEAMLLQITEKMNEAMAQLPPEQRAIAEQMMQARMGSNEVAPPHVEETGSGEWDGRACSKFDVFENDIKTQEVCAAPLDKVHGAAEMMETYQAMARFVKKLSESLPGPLGASFNEYPGMVAELIGGFPIHTIEFRLGAPVSQVALESITEKALEPSMFEAPADYRLEDPFAGP